MWKSSHINLKIAPALAAGVNCDVSDRHCQLPGQVAMDLSLFLHYASCCASCCACVAASAGTDKESVAESSPVSSCIYSIQQIWLAYRLVPSWLSTTQAGVHVRTHATRSLFWKPGRSIVSAGGRRSAPTDFVSHQLIEREAA